MDWEGSHSNTSSNHFSVAWLVADETAVRQITASLNVQTSLMEVGCILSDESQGNIVYKFNVKNMGHTINSASDIVAMCCCFLSVNEDGPEIYLNESALCSICAVVSKCRRELSTVILTRKQILNWNLP